MNSKLRFRGRRSTSYEPLWLCTQRERHDYGVVIVPTNTVFHQTPPIKRKVEIITNLFACLTFSSPYISRKNRPTNTSAHHHPTVSRQTVCRLYFSASFIVTGRVAVRTTTTTIQPTYYRLVQSALYKAEEQSDYVLCTFLKTHCQFCASVAHCCKTTYVNCASYITHSYTIAMSVHDNHMQEVP